MTYPEYYVIDDSQILETTDISAWEESNPDVDAIPFGDWLDLPDWIEPQFDEPEDVRAVSHGGCNSGAYMPACTYHVALETMSNHGNDVLQYIEDQLGELPTVPHGESWSGLACFYLSCAVELWAHATVDLIDDLEVVS